MALHCPEHKEKKKFSPAKAAPIVSKNNGSMQDNVAGYYQISLNHCTPETDTYDSMPPEIMPPGYRKLMKDDTNGDTAFDTACMAKEGMLQRLELLQQTHCCISWGADFTAIRGVRLPHRLLHQDKQSHQLCTLQIRSSRKGGPHRGASHAEAGVIGMLDFCVPMDQHAPITEGLAAFQMLTSPLLRAVMVPSTKETISVLGMLMVRPFTAQIDCMKSRSC